MTARVRRLLVLVCAGLAAGCDSGGDARPPDAAVDAPVDLAVDAADTGDGGGADARGPAPHFAIVYLDNDLQDFARRGWLDPASAFQRNIAHAAARWAAVLVSPHTVNLHVQPTRQLARAGGTYSNGRLLRQVGALRVWEPGVLTRLLTGANPGAAAQGGADMLLYLNAEYVEAQYFIDPDPEAQSAIPAGQTDLVSIVLHELGHALGMAGVRRLTREGYGEPAGPDISSFDALTMFGGDGAALVEEHPSRLLYLGPRGLALADGTLALASYDFDTYLFSQNHYHFGDFSLDPESPDAWQRRCAGERPSPEAGALMTSCPVPTDGRRLRIDALDLAMLADLGYPVRQHD